MTARELYLKSLGQKLLGEFEKKDELDAYEMSQVLLAALDLHAFRFEQESDFLAYDFFKRRVLDEMDRVSGLIELAKP